MAIVAMGVFSSVSGQTPAGELSRTADGKPRLDGIWQALAEANWDIGPHAAGPAPLAVMGTFGAIHPGPGIVEGDEIPYQPWAAERQKENFANRLELDPEGKCFLPGVPRATYLPYPLPDSADASVRDDRLSIRERGAHRSHDRSRAGAG